MKILSFLVFSSFILWVLPAQADMVQIKAYKEAFPDTKLKCINCHADEHPKKDDGQHENNDYGKAAVTAAKAVDLDKPNADIYKKIGTIEDFSKISSTK